MIKINKFTKLKDGNYKLILEDGRELKIHEDLILKYDLLLTKNLDQKQEDTLKEEQKIYDIYNIALKYIKIKIRSIKEIENYLLKKQFTKEEIIQAINILKHQGYLNNEMYAAALIHDRIYLSNDGPLKIREELRKNDIEESVVEKKLLVFDESLEKEKIQKLIDKQVKTNRNRSNWMLKKKIENNLITLGYHSYLIQELLSQIKIEDKSIYHQEYDKLYKKLSRKYEGKELEYKIKQKLYQKGFKNFEE